MSDNVLKTALLLAMADKLIEQQQNQPSTFRWDLAIALNECFGRGYQTAIEHASAAQERAFAKAGVR